MPLSCQCGSEVSAGFAKSQTDPEVASGRGDGAQDSHRGAVVRFGAGEVAEQHSDRSDPGIGRTGLEPQAGIVPLLGCQRAVLRRSFLQKLAPDLLSAGDLGKACSNAGQQRVNRVARLGQPAPRLGPRERLCGERGLRLAARPFDQNRGQTGDGRDEQERSRAAVTQLLCRRIQRRVRIASGSLQADTGSSAIHRSRSSASALGVG